MDVVTVLAQHAGGENNLWDPTILGVLVVLSAVGLFCGSVYLLLGTNLGARLGFLVAGACLTGFMVLLSSLWITTATPLNSPKGRPAEWQVIDVVDDPSDSGVEAVRNIAEEGDQVNAEELALLRPAIDAALVTAQAEGGEEPEPQEFAQYGRSTDFLTDFEGFQSFTVGGGTRNVFWHTPRYAVVEFCDTLAVEPPAGEAPPPPRCDPLTGRRFAVMQYDFGSLRQPPWIYFFTSLVLFGLFLLGLHWYEQDARERKKAGTSLRPVPTS
jgi:hypothetical protein